MDQTIELFCGAEKPFSRIADALGYATFTVDLNPEAEPNLVSSITELLAEKMPKSPLIAWAAPPYSEAFQDLECWESDGSFQPRTSEAQDAIEQLRNTIGLLSALKPTWWFIEHPKSLLRTMPLFAGFNRGYPTRNRRTISHREFGAEMHGMSDIWTNAFWWLPRSSDSTEEQDNNTPSYGRVPPYVYAQMFEQLDNYRRSGPNQMPLQETLN